MSHREDFEHKVRSIASLTEPVRRALYRYVASRPAPVTREEAATAVGVPSHVAKFNLDRLEADGLLESDFARPPGRSGPGAGRPAKRYRRTGQEIGLSLPERRYELAGRIMAEALTAARDGVPVPQALRDAAASTGRRLAGGVREALGARRSRTAARRAVVEVLDETGFEPEQDGHEIRLANCPFHALAEDYTDLVCGLNLDLMQALVNEGPPAGLRPSLEPSAGRCCVVLRQVR